MDIDVNIIEAQSLTQELGSNIGNLSMLLSLYSVLFLITSFITLHVVFSLIIGERKKEFAIMRILGATQKIVAKSMLLEAFVISGVGAIVGSGLSMLLISSFSTFIETSLGLPYINIAITTQISMILITILITTLVGPLAVLTTVSGINKAETFITMKEGE
jgi:putative ABC transport system permease protein